jgi:hypothetical protein
MLDERKARGGASRERNWGSSEGGVAGLGGNGLMADRGGRRAEAEGVQGRIARPTAGGARVEQQVWEIGVDARSGRAIRWHMGSGDVHGQGQGVNRQTSVRVQVWSGKGGRPGVDYRLGPPEAAGCAGVGAGEGCDGNCKGGGGSRKSGRNGVGDGLGARAAMGARGGGRTAGMACNGQAESRKRDCGGGEGGVASLGGQEWMVNRCGARGRGKRGSRDGVQGRPGWSSESGRSGVDG